jgi:hypothetical protein
MRTFQHQSVKKSRKRRRCDWCGETIEVGQPYDSYRFAISGDAGTVRMHPECLEASGEVAKQEGGWLEWTVGEYRRGSTGYE